MKPRELQVHFKFAKGTPMASEEFWLSLKPEETIHFIEKSAFDELAAENEKLKKELHSTRIIPDTPELVQLRAENEKYRNHIKEHCGINECPACGERYYNQPDFETFHHVEIERDKLRAANAELVAVVEQLAYFGPGLIEKEYEVGSDTIKNLVDRAKQALSKHGGTGRNEGET